MGIDIKLDNTPMELLWKLTQEWAGYFIVEFHFLLISGAIKDSSLQLQIER